MSNLSKALSRAALAPSHPDRSRQHETELFFLASKSLRNATKRRAKMRWCGVLTDLAQSAYSERVRRNAAAAIKGRSERVEFSEASPVANQIKMFWKTAHELRRAQAADDLDLRSEWQDMLEILIIHAASRRILRSCLALQADDWAHYGDGPSAF